MYQDEVSFKQAGSILRHWALKGIGCVVKTPPTRKSIKVMGAVTIGDRPLLWPGGSTSILTIFRTRPDSDSVLASRIPRYPDTPVIMTFFILVPISHLPLWKYVRSLDQYNQFPQFLLRLLFWDGYPRIGRIPGKHRHRSQRICLEDVYSIDKTNP